VNARIISGEFLHFVEAVFDPVEFLLITQMPLTREVSRVTVFWKNLAIVEVEFVRPLGSPGNHHDRKGRADWVATGHEGGAAGSSACLTMPACEHGAFSGDAVNVRSWLTEVRTATIAAEVVPAGVVGHQHHDAGFLVLRLQGVRLRR
jgi:hypothetical protein